MGWKEMFIFNTLLQQQQAQFNQRMAQASGGQTSGGGVSAERQAEQKRRDDLRKQMLGYNDTLGEGGGSAGNVTVNTLG